MQNGSVIKTKRRSGQSVWEFRWRDRTSGKAVYRRIVLGSAQQFPTEIEARAAARTTRLELATSAVTESATARNPPQLIRWKRVVRSVRLCNADLSMLPIPSPIRARE